jgi:hypothetical protein
MEQLVYQGLQANKALKVPMVRVDKMANKASLDQMEQQGLQDCLVWLELEEILVMLEAQGHKVHKDLLAKKDQWDLPDNPAKLVLKETPALSGL